LPAALAVTHIFVYRSTACVPSGPLIHREGGKYRADHAEDPDARGCKAAATGPGDNQGTSPQAAELVTAGAWAMRLAHIAKAGDFGSLYLRVALCSSLSRAWFALASPRPPL
jgi:hypothetical protein